MPPQVTAITGIDALTHAIEAHINIRANPISDALCLQAIQDDRRNLRRVVARGDDITARGENGAGSLMAGVGFSSAGLRLCMAGTSGRSTLQCRSRHGERYFTAVCTGI